MRLVIVESPFSGDTNTNIAYARAAVKDCLKRGESPIASHLLYTQPGILLDSNPEHRKLGIEAGLAWRWVADWQVFYTDLDWSPGMLSALAQVLKEPRTFRVRSISGKPMMPPRLSEREERIVKLAMKDQG